MYSTCLFCNKPLGTNEVLEIFPVGRRLAWDAARGRLWVVCRACERWNLSPLEERWETIEHCERLYSATRLRVSTENIGLARLKEGLELVRIGAPQRPEFAAWRYGDQFGRRRRSTLLKVGAGLGAVGLAAAGAMSAGVGFIGMWWGGQGIVKRIVRGNPHEVVAHLRDNDERLVRVQRRHLEHAQLVDENGEWALSIADPRRHDHGGGWRAPLILRGEHARRAAGPLLVAINRYGGTKRGVAAAVSLLERHDDPARFVSVMAQRVGVREPLFISRMSEPSRLALEMAVHEESERRALEGELHALERAWREADEIAGIADQLLLPKDIGRALDRLRGRDD